MVNSFMIIETVQIKFSNYCIVSRHQSRWPDQINYSDLLNKGNIRHFFGISNTSLGFEPEASLIFKPVCHIRFDTDTTPAPHEPTENPIKPALGGAWPWPTCSQTDNTWWVDNCSWRALVIGFKTACVILKSSSQIQPSLLESLPLSSWSITGNSIVDQDICRPSHQSPPQPFA